MRWRELLHLRPQPKTRTVVTFTGGMGAQIISAAIYYSLRDEGREVLADLTYFDRVEHVAAAGNPGDCSHWSWQLDAFGLGKDSFESAGSYSKRDINLVEDGTEKLALGLSALRRPKIQGYFAMADGVDDILPAQFSPDYLCIHVRRGDYVNVASHLVTDREFIDLAAKFAGMVRSIVVVSDSPIDIAFRAVIAEGYDQAAFLDNIDALASHRIMRNARILICSNSQFSLIAALLNARALVVLPKQWFAGKDRAIEVPISEACDFQILGKAL